jgi:signal transduction histidine kinase
MPRGARLRCIGSRLFDTAPATAARTPSPAGAWLARVRRLLDTSDGALWLVAAAGAVAAALTFILTARSTTLADPLYAAVLRGFQVASWTGVGLVTVHRRRNAELGAIMVLVGAVAAASTVMAFPQPWLFLAGRLLRAADIVVVLLAFLAFPWGRIEDVASRRLLRVAVVGTVALWTPLVLGGHPLPVAGATGRCTADCPATPLKLFSLGSVGTGLEWVARASTAALLLALAWVLLQRYRRASAATRRSLTLPLSCVAVTGVLLAIGTLLDGPEAGGAAPSRPTWLGVVTWSLLPYAFLLGQTRGQLFGVEALHRAVRALAPHDHRGDVRDVLAEALGDPALELWYWVPTLEGYVDRSGRPVRLDHVAPRAATRIEVAGEPVAAIVHDPGLDASPGLVEAAGNAALLALENGRLEAELRSTIEELRASRARLVSAGIEERRRLERDLHDTAQNGLVALRIRLGLAAERAAEVDADLAGMMVALAEEAQTALEGIRRVARGMYPPLLTSGGVVDALDAELSAAAVPVRLVAAPDVGRSTPQAEVAVYFACWEAVQNAAKHAGRGASVTIRLRRHDGELAFSVYDDGVGFDPRETPEGFGRTAMRDRLGAVGGSLDVHSSPRHGTLVSGCVPWPPRAPVS